jgi:uroporphyrinogen decarboxylase
MTERENYIRAARFERPDHIPAVFHINDASYISYPQDQLFDLMESHRTLFPGFMRPAGNYAPAFSVTARKDRPYTDDFGCLWMTAMDGMTGTVTGHPLSDWSRLDEYRAPDPEISTGIGPVNWYDISCSAADEKTKDGLIRGGLRHGHTFLQLCDIRGYQNIIYDMADDDRRLSKLIYMIEEFNLHIVNKYLETGLDVMSYPDDLGMQKGPMLSLRHFRKYIKPSYMRIMRPARESDVLVHMHSDGDIRGLADDIAGCGVDIINIQDLVNGIGWIADRFAGSVCVDLDIDRQSITVDGTPEMIDSLILDEVRSIGRKEGGLMLIYGLYPGIPMENVKAVMDAMERYASYYS